jgi:hypothetical protein
MQVHLHSTRAGHLQISVGRKKQFGKATNCFDLLQLPHVAQETTAQCGRFVNQFLPLLLEDRESDALSPKYPQRSK